MKKLKVFKKRQAWKLTGLVAVLLVMMLWLAGVFRHKIQPGPPQEPAKVTVGQTVRVQAQRFPTIVEQAGTVRTRTEAQVSSRLMAQVLEVLVREGDRVQGPGPAGNKATVLARLDDRDIQARLQQAQAQAASLSQSLAAARAQEKAAQALLDQAVADLGRTEKLVEAKAATGQQLDHARTQRDTAQAQVLAVQGQVQQVLAQQAGAAAAVHEAEVMESFAAIEAPFDGQVTSRRIDPGDMVSPGQTLFDVDVPSEPQLQAYVSEGVAVHLKPGQSLQVVIDALHLEVGGRVRQIVPQADPQTRTVLVKVDLPKDPALVSGLFGWLRVPVGEYEALVVQKSAVRQSGQLNLVRVLAAPGVPVRRFVQIGQEHGPLVEVLSGLQPGDEVITD
jgi:RND family efflux transporter MFP subunit